MPSRREIESYKTLSRQALDDFRIFMAAGRLPKPDHMPRGAFDARPAWYATLTRASSAQRRQLRLALDEMERQPHYTEKEDNPARDNVKVPGGERLDGATDQDGDEDAQAAQHLLHCLSGKIDPDDLVTLHRILAGQFGGLTEPAGETATDDGEFGGPEKFEGEPLRGGKMVAQDAAMVRRRVERRMSAAAAYDSRWGSLTNRIGLDNTPGAR